MLIRDARLVALTDAAPPAPVDVRVEDGRVAEVGAGAGRGRRRDVVRRGRAAG